MALESGTRKPRTRSSWDFLDWGCFDRGKNDPGSRRARIWRYATILPLRTDAGRTCQVVLEVPRSLARLLSGLKGWPIVVASGDPSPRADAWIPMMSLPLAFRTTLETIPRRFPYLHADPERSAAWRKRLTAFPGRKIGLVWAGSPRPGDTNSNAIDRRRSITLRHYVPLAAVPGLCLISLQKGDAGAQARTPRRE